MGTLTNDTCTKTYILGDWNCLNWVQLLNYLRYHKLMKYKYVNESRLLSVVLTQSRYIRNPYSTLAQAHINISANCHVRWLYMSITKYIIRFLHYWRHVEMVIGKDCFSLVTIQLVVMTKITWHVISEWCSLFRTSGIICWMIVCVKINCVTSVRKSALNRRWRGRNWFFIITCRLIVCEVSMHLQLVD